jgi:hypothetical protein
VDIDKKFKGKKPQKIIKLSREGRKAFDLYREKLEQMLRGLSEK